MKQSSILAVSGLLSFAAAVPFFKRDLVTVVVTQEVIETIDITTTIWVPAGGAPTVPTSVGNYGHGNSVSATSSVSTSIATSTSSPVAASAVSQAASSTLPAQSPTSQSSSSVSSTSTTSTIAPPSSTPSVPAYTPPASTTSSAPAYTPLASTTSTTSQAPAPAPVTPVASATSSCPAFPNPATTPGVLPGAYFPASCNSSSGGCSGDITYYDVGQGACGVVSSADQPVIALSYLLMGTASNSNPLCGKTVTIHNANTGASAQATVVDKCMGCCNQANIDMSKSLFKTLNGGSLDAGRVTSGFSWYFND